MTDFDLAFGALVASRRKRKKLTQIGLARLLDISQSHVSRIEAGARPVTVVEAHRLDAVFRSDLEASAKRVIDIASKMIRMLSFPEATAPMTAADLVPIIAARMP